jgi:7-carboxy-7-deazaguanine synthase (Cx14CxxC type)
VTYAVKEVFYTLQGEGANAGRPAVFCRFAGCNLWTGLEQDRHKAVCRFCDTDFVGVDGTLGGKYRSAAELAATVAREWPPVNGRSRPLVVCTGGEPLLQLDAPLVDAFHAAGFEIAVETNGTLQPPPGIDWICVSPKAGSETVLLRGNELKLVYPQERAQPDRFADADFEHFYLQPMDGPELEANIAATIAYCLAHPQWRLSLQTHKITGIR